MTRADPLPPQYFPVKEAPFSKIFTPIFGDIEAQLKQKADARAAERFRALESIMDGIPGQRAIAKRVSARVMGYEVTFFGETVRAKTLQSLADAIIEQQAEQEKPLTPAPPNPR